MAHTYLVNDDDDFDPQDDLRPEYDFAALRVADQERLKLLELKLQAVRAAMRDPLFIADAREIAEDFKHTDAEETEQ